MQLHLPWSRLMGFRSRSSSKSCADEAPAMKCKERQASRTRRPPKLSCVVAGMPDPVVPRPTDIAPDPLPKFEKRIEQISENGFAKNYRMGAQVRKSGNRGMEIVFATRLRDGLDCIIKIRHKDQSWKRMEDRLAWCEIMETMLNLPRSAGLCELYEVLETPTAYFVVMERCEGGDFFEQLTAGKVKVDHVPEIFRQILEGVAALHSQNLVHRDLKLRNVVVDINETSGVRAKLIDFDTVVEHSSTLSSKWVLGTDGYIAPESYIGTYAPQSDIFSIAVMWYRVNTGKYPFNIKLFDDAPNENFVGSPSMTRIYERLRTEKVDFRSQTFQADPALACLLRDMLAFRLEDRPSAESALGYQYFEQRKGPKHDRWAVSPKELNMQCSTTLPGMPARTRGGVMRTAMAGA